MAKGCFRKTDRICALCRHLNGAIGSTTIQPVLGGRFQVEMKEKETCYQSTGQTQATFVCSKFEPRY